MASPNRTISPSEPQAETLSAFEGVVSNEDAEKQTERLIGLYSTGEKDENRGICILHDERKWSHTASEIYAWYHAKSLPCSIISYSKPNWLDNIKSSQASHFLFLGLPPFDRGKKGFSIKRPVKSPVDSSQAEVEFFLTKNCQLNRVIVVLPEKIPTKREYRQKISGHYLDKYLKLDGNKRPSVLAASALGVFAAPKPQALKTDNVYWSETPKLVEDFRVSSQISLGLTIMTREMAEGAPFTCIVLINSISSEFRYDFYANVAKYTHIQSINGILLDGLSIEKVTNIFKKLPDHHIQLMIRYIHTIGEKEEKKDEPTRDPSSYSPLRELPNRPSTCSITSEPQPSHSSSIETPRVPSGKGGESLVLPLPLYILGDNYPLRKKLFQLLSDDGPLTPETPPSSRGSGSSLPSTPQRVGNGYHRSLSVPSTASSEKDLLSSTSLDDITEGEEVNSPGSGSNSSNYRPHFQERSVRRRSCSFKGISSSDKYMQRVEVPVSKFDKLPETQNSDMDLPIVTSPVSPVVQERAESTSQQFILHLPSQDLDRLMTHLYFKPSGIYMIVIGLEDLVTNPLCQFENLFYWVNLIHTYVSPEVKRMFVVGMYNRSTIAQKDVLNSVKILNEILGKYRQTAKNPHIEQGYVYLFDIENSLAECEHLCSFILKCADLFSKSSYYFAREFHNSIFTPFKQFQKIASDIGLNNDRALMESKFTMGQRFKVLFGGNQHLHLPNGYYDTLAAYSTACISRHCDGCLLIPSAIPDLLNVCAHLDNFHTSIFDEPQLRNLPLVSINMLQHAFCQLYPRNNKDFELIIWWMEHLSIIYTVGKLHKDEKFFIPFLLHYQLSDRSSYEWNEDKVQQLFSNATVLYAQFSMHVPMTIHLFHKIIAYILKSILKEGTQPECYLNPDSPEVVLPLHDDNDDFLCLVLVKYHAVQNIIEFQANILNRIKFLHVVENKLSKAFLGSQYYNKTIDVNRVVSFRIPIKDVTRESIGPNLWDLAQLESSQDDVEDHLVATCHLTEPGNRRITAVLKRWADRAPEAKEIPADLSLEICRKLFLSENWVQFVANLNLMSPEEIQILRQRVNSDPGAVALERWRESSLTVSDLVKALRELHLDKLASKVFDITGMDDDSLIPYAHDSKILEKKLPADLFLSLSKVLNQGDKWASLGDFLNFFNVVEIENLRQKQLVDKGQHVLQLWTDSHLTYQDLINGLRSPQVRLDGFVPHIEEIIKSHNAQLS